MSSITTTTTRSYRCYSSSPPSPPPPPQKSLVLATTHKNLVFKDKICPKLSMISHNIRTCSRTVKHIPSSSTSPTPTIEEDEQQLDSSTLDELPLDSETNFNSLSSTRGCKACGREEIERGCNGEGRIQGGIAVVPGFGWWPIKAYRPCPGFVECGGRYRRTGQSMDEVAFGRGEREAPVETDAKGKSRKKKQDPSRLRK